MCSLKVASRIRSTLVQKNSVMSTRWRSLSPALVRYIRLWQGTKGDYVDYEGVAILVAKEEESGNGSTHQA